MKARNFHLKSKGVKEHTYFKKNLLQIVFTDTENAILIINQWIFDQQAKKFHLYVSTSYQRNSNLFHQNVAVSKKMNFSREFSLEDIGSNFDNPSDFFSTEGRKLFPHCPRATKHKFSRKPILQTVCFDALSADLITQLKNLRQKCWKLCLNLQNWWKSIFFSKKTVFPLNFLGTLRMQFWQDSPKNYDKRLKNIRSISENLEINSASRYVFILSK